jgi:hypothetical protein
MGQPSHVSLGQYMVPQLPQQGKLPIQYLVSVMAEQGQYDKGNVKTPF